MDLGKDEGNVLPVHCHPQKTVTVTQNGQLCMFILSIHKGCIWQCCSASIILQQCNCAWAVVVNHMFW